MKHNKQRRKKAKRTNPWSLDRVVKGRLSAAAVWIALNDLAEEKGSSVVTPTRKDLSTRTGVSEKYISKALTRLEEAGWIDRHHVPVQHDGQRTATLLRVTIRRNGQSKIAANNRSDAPRGRRRQPPKEAMPANGTGSDCRKGRLTTATAHMSVDGVEGPEGKGCLTPQDFPSERGGASSPSPLLCDGAPPHTQRLGKREDIQNGQASGYVSRTAVRPAHNNPAQVGPARRFAGDVECDPMPAELTQLLALIENGLPDQLDDSSVAAGDGADPSQPTARTEGGQR